MPGPPTSYLYVPGDRPERFERAFNSGAHAVILDLEDAVPIHAKDDARWAVADRLASTVRPKIEVWVRVNAGDRGLDDAAGLSGLPELTGFVVPKATKESLAAIAAVTSAPLLPLIESGAGFLDLRAIAEAEGVTGLALGEIDLIADLGLDPSPDDRELLPLRMQAVAVAAAYGLRPPVGPVYIAVKDSELLRASTEALRRAGFESRQAIHPSQVEVINQVFIPTTDALAKAKETLALASGGGAVLDGSGRMVDEAVLRRARRIVDRWEASNPPPPKLL